LIKIIQIDLDVFFEDVSSQKSNLTFWVHPVQRIVSADDKADHNQLQNQWSSSTTNDSMKPCTH